MLYESEHFLHVSVILLFPKVCCKVEVGESSKYYSTIPALSVSAAFTQSEKFWGWGERWLTQSEPFSQVMERSGQEINHSFWLWTVCEIRLKFTGCRLPQNLFEFLFFLILSSNRLMLNWCCFMSNKMKPDHRQQDYYSIYLKKYLNVWTHCQVLHAGKICNL